VSSESQKAVSELDTTNNTFMALPQVKDSLLMRAV
jgi:hypothetical protein